MSRFSSITNRLSVREQILLIKRLSFLINAGVPIVESLSILKKQKGSRAKTRILESIARDVESGQRLAKSFAKFRYAFGDFAINIIHVGESGGILAQNLQYLAEELKKKHALKRKITSALVYPVFILVATLGITGVLILVIFPKIMPIFKSLNVALPITTRILIATSDFVGRYWIALISFSVIGFAGSLISFRKIPFMRRTSGRIFIKLPVVGSVIQSYQMTNFCRTLGLLLKSGVHVGEAIWITAETTAHLCYRDTYRKLSKNITKGKSISSFLEQHPSMFPDIALHMIAIGETTGNLSDTLLYLSDMYEGEVDEFTKNLSSTIEPVLMVVMGFIVGFIAISIITPIYGITQSLTPK